MLLTELRLKARSDESQSATNIQLGSLSLRKVRKISNYLQPSVTSSQRIPNGALHRYLALTLVLIPQTIISSLRFNLFEIWKYE